MGGFVVFTVGCVKRTAPDQRARAAASPKIMAPPGYCDIVLCPLEFRLRSLSGRGAETPKGPGLTQCMVRPCVARGFRRFGGFAVLHQCIRPLIGARLCSRPSWISARVRSHYRTGLERAIWVTSVRTRREDRSSISSHPLADLGG